MTTREELGAELDKVWLDVGVGVINLVEALNVIESALKAYNEELKKQENTND